MFKYFACILPSAIGVVYFRRLSRPALLSLWSFASLLLFLLVPAGSRDIAQYVSSFSEVLSTPFLELLQKDPLFYLTTYVFAKIGFPAEIFFLSLASLALFIKYKAISQLAEGSIYVVLIYMGSYFYLHEFTQIRIALALGVWMFALSHLAKSPKKYLWISLLATAIHLEAALSLLPYMLWQFVDTERKRHIFLAIAILIFTLGLVHLIDNIGDAIIRSIPDPRTELYFAMRESSDWERPNLLSLTNLWALGTSIVVLVPRVGRMFRFQAKATDFVIAQSILLGSVALPLLSSMPVAAYRVSEYFLCLLPVQFARIIEPQNRPTKVVATLALGLTLAYAYIFKFQILITS